MANYESQKKTHNNARIIHAPRNEPPSSSRRSLFLSGSTDAATTTDWRAVVSTSLDHLPISIYDPQRPDWDSTWIPDISFAPFREQVEWELKMLESVDVIAVYFSPRSESPITLLELGLFTNTKKAVVACPKEFWRRGNVEIVCARYGVKMVENLDDLVQELERRLTEKTPDQLAISK
ncbi:hypothetical protein HYPSUDRAFT_190962 [Hypholoma sublateritium FD-334 SS-4]|uniref:TIR domain-containing protein n=1 Tax=Hypholoma sublateritium (strain FD-334 SS-4) TaxID=945553 RepID=A0A0D2NNN5_HYPSF|nr:hypothetical protein HYPSUDRAFT_190962 [Hypholoma sublateritium FD-334 SS-4]